MESTQNFQSGLLLAYNDLLREKRLSRRDRKVVGRLLQHPFIVVNGRRIHAMGRVHLRIRRLYAKHLGFAPINLDWTTIVQWIKDNWADIVRLILVILPFLL